MKAKEEADKLEAEVQRSSPQRRRPQNAGASDAGHKTQLAAQAVDAAAKKAMEAAELAREATAAMESLKQFNEPGAETEERKLSPQTRSKNNIGFSKPYSIRCAALFYNHNHCNRTVFMLKSTEYLSEVASCFYRLKN